MTTLKYPGLQKYDEKIKDWIADVTSPMVHKSGNENISGIKNFSESPLVPTPATTDDSKKSVNSEWVRSIFSSVGGFSFGDDGKVYVDFSQMDPAVMRAVVTAMILPGGGLASDTATGNLYVDFDEMDPDIMREVVLSMVQPGSGLAVDDTTGQLYVDFSLMPTDKFEALLASIHVPVWIGENGVGTEFYVDAATGVDTRADEQGKSAAKPWATISYATQQICQNYNINSRTVHINVAGGTYTQEVSLPLQQRTTGSIVIRPLSDQDTVNIVRTVTGTSGFCLSHTGGVWVVQDINLKLIVNQQTFANGWIYPGIVYSSDDSGYVTLQHCNMEFEDNSVAPVSGTYGRVTMRLIRVYGGAVRIRNTTGDTSADFESSWSGTKGNATVQWLSIKGGTLTMFRPGASASQGYKYNVSGSFTTFCVCTDNGRYLIDGDGPDSVWVKVDSPTGQRYAISTGGTISTGTGSAAAAQIYFPGDTDGTVDIGNYSWISPHADYFARNVRFDSTPVYTATLVEDTAATVSSPYTIPLGDGIRNAVVLVTAPAGSGASGGFVGAVFSTNDTLSYYNSSLFQNSQRAIYAELGIDNGLGYAAGASGASFPLNASLANRIVSPPIILNDSATITSITLSISGTGSYGTNLLTGTTITVYAAAGA